MDQDEELPPEIEDAIEEHLAREEFGITTAVPGTWMPEAAYRPVPIVWFGGAFVLQSIQLIVFTIMFATKQPIYTAGTTLIATLAIAFWTWNRGIRGSTPVWQAATFGMLGFFWFWAAASAFSR